MQETHFALAALAILRTQHQAYPSGREDIERKDAMSLHPRPLLKAVEVPGLAYFSATAEGVKAVVPVPLVKQPIDALNEMYAYYSES
jgi:hypothetical protein